MTDTKQTRVVKKTVPTDSFFNFFSPPKPPADDDEEIAEDIEERLELDYSIGEDIKEKLIPRAVDWFTGEALQHEGILGDDLDENEFEDDDDLDEDDLSDDRDEDDDSDEDVGIVRTSRSIMLLITISTGRWSPLGETGHCGVQTVMMTEMLLFF